MADEAATRAMQDLAKAMTELAAATRATVGGGKALPRMLLMTQDESGNIGPLNSSGGGLKMQVTGSLAQASGDGLSDQKILLSGSTNGKGIKVAATATPGDTIHAATASTTWKDFLHLFAVNTSALNVKLTLEWGTAVAADGNIEQTIRAEDGLFPLTPADGLPLNNSLIVKAFAATTNVILIFGYVRRVRA